MNDLLGALAITLIGTLICVSGYLNFRDARKRARGSGRWSRAHAQITKAWKQDVSGASGDALYHVNYTFTAPETGGSYYGHSERGPQDAKAGDDIEVVYDPSGPYNNELPMPRFARSFLPTAFGVLIIVGAALALAGLIGTVVISVELIG
ncbi:DUF3592 domain-containing protein [Nocardioides sp. CCNWLW239]|uniref:DUF3592 domain-containing protein n=1 Tax=Nocardioides sp. CCNWLW239 TaxID=3128902 RepID=UPI003016E208